MMSTLWCSDRIAVSGALLSALLTAGCGGGGGRGGGDNVRLVLTGDAAIESLAGVAQSSAFALAAYFTYEVEVSTGAVPCAIGGSAVTTCARAGGSSRLDTTFSVCRDEFAGGGTITKNGRLTVNIGDPHVCTTGFIPPEALLTFRFQNVTAQLTDADGNPSGRLDLDLTDAIRVHGAGCLGANVTRSINGTLRLELPERGVDLTATARALELDAESSGAPCALHVVADGHLEVDDRGNERAFAETFHAMLVTLTDDGRVAFDGSATTDCVGDVDFNTLEPFAVGNVNCPTGGAMGVRLPDGTESTIRFTESGGLEFDGDGDGVAERAIDDCRDLSLQQCSASAGAADAQAAVQ